MAISYSVPTVNASGTVIVNDVHTAPTSTWPYDSVGPVQFSQLNFVNTCETDFYYSQVYPNGTVPLLVSEVKQCYDGAVAFWTISLIGFLSLACLGVVVWFISKRSKHVSEAFHADV